jgi:type IV pilus assembly protein PilV
MFMIHRAKRKATASASRQRGLSLIESLVAVLVLALGIMGLAGVQARMLAENRTTNARAVAVGLIDDLSNRMLLNRNAVAAGNYDSGFLAGAAIGVAGTDCSATACTGAQLATWDLIAWRTTMRSLLGPGSDSAVFRPVATDPSQVGIMIAWSANEGSNGSGGTRDTTVFQFLSGTATNCPVDAICHLVYVRP